MQIFVLDLMPSMASRSHCDKHVVKQILEACQLLCATMRLHNISYGYKITHKNHPCRLWLDQSRENFLWLKDLGLYLSEEYTYRYGRRHKSQDIIADSYVPPEIPSIGLTPFAQAMPDEYKVKDDAVQAYRNYYLGAKKDLLVYTKREPPEWARHQ